ncbi:MAG: 16S rRNA (cytosine(1402)-N(4))-methyltransferase RsmH [Planctomycetota bacterium]|jgi:16S rRNA (cytosine1402-N4)-methyltransferase|nr:16S rRNA (cytosine(1402)-N(4))-methyltransferase RsmH [Planctomycetota bacterium]
MTPPGQHIPVLAEETLTLLAPAPGELAVDATVGLGGHSRLIGARLGREGSLFCFDRDRQALDKARENLSDLACHLHFLPHPFDAMGVELSRLGTSRVERILLDLGVSSLQLDSPERGFSFLRDGPLDMRMDPTQGQTAATLVNQAPLEELIRLFQDLGEERFAKRIARIIVEKRAKQPITTTGGLAELVSQAVPGRGRRHPATRVFQALRMEVNDEPGMLCRGLAAAGRLLSPGGRLAVITFHSLEDRPVKRLFRRWQELGLVKIITSSPVLCSRPEARLNPRARSAKLRVVERT